MIKVRRGDDRGRTKLDWLDSRHTFSFGDFHDPRHMGFSHLRVINEDRVVAGAGFGTHSHRDMEIVTYVLEGALAHKDSTGTSSVIRVGDVQRMSAGTGVRHSEENASLVERVHLLQIWILPDTIDLEPSYEQKAFSEDERRGQLRLIASEDGRDGSVTVHQDVSLFASILAADQEVMHEMDPLRYAWIQVARGAITINGESALQGDGVVVTGESRLTIKAEEPGEVLLFDLK
jgi:redox-sensitive bicupin YhaK (pirin superfamily)